jgi:hypothetical protein
MDCFSLNSFTHHKEAKMRIPYIALTIVIVVLMASVVFGQEDVMVSAESADISESLDLQAVSELFKESETLEDFEKSLNDPSIGINNLDLDEDGDVDFIRVVEEVADDTHVIILQVPMEGNVYQDVATIEVEKADEESYNLQIHGNDDLYGKSYYVAPAAVYIHTWPIIRWMYRPAYRPYRSVYRYGYYPRWWKPYRRVTINVYRPRTVRYTQRKHFVVTKTSRVKTVHRVGYKPHSSPRVKRKAYRAPGRPGKPKPPPRSPRRTARPPKKR